MPVTSRSLFSLFSQAVCSCETRTSKLRLVGSVDRADPRLINAGDVCEVVNKIIAGTFSKLDVLSRP